jgi:hypothetical protein
MNIQKTPGNVNNESAQEITAHKTAAKTNAAQGTAQTAKPAASAVSKAPQSASAKPAVTQAAARSVASLISAAGLPADKLSASIVSFARFFSLPLKPELLKNIRQQAFEAAPNGKSPETIPAAEDSEAEVRGSSLESKTGNVFKNRETLSLAAAAAEGKGAELQSKGLETYAQAVDPEWRQRQDGGQGDQHRRRKREDNENEEKPLQKTMALNAADLKKTVLEEAEKNPLLAILNRLPDKDGKRWIVLPFDFSDNGREFKVSLRILLETGKAANRADCIALDVAIHDTDENGGTEKRRLFVLEPANRLSVYLQPEISAKEQDALVRELSALLEIAPERIFIKTQTEAFPFEAGRGDDLLRSIDEAV